VRTNVLTFVRTGIKLLGVWIVFCAEKNEMLKNKAGRLSVSLDDCITEISNGDFLVIDSPSKEQEGQKSFLLEINDYPIIVPFNIRGSVIQLVTLFPDRRYKNE
jgi:hypothetical protein